MGFFDDCFNMYEIDVKNCLIFLVYKLILLDVCDVVYCFGNYVVLFYICNCYGYYKS